MMKFPLFLTTSLAFSFLKGLVSATSVSHPVFDSHRHKLRSTGTTIAGVCLPSGVLVLGADTRATDDRIVADKYCSKIHFLANGIYACGAGTSGDLEAVTRQVRYSLLLQSLQEAIGNCEESSSQISIHKVCKLLKDHLYETRGSLGVNLIIGSASGHLVALHPHGSMEIVPYAALGSGGLAAMAVLEARYEPNLTLQQAKQLVQHAIQAGIDNDLGSGSQVDLCILGPSNRVEYIKAAVEEQKLTHSFKTEDDVGGGVNGFGNVEYEEQSRRMMKSREREQHRKVDEWHDLRQ